MPGLASLLSRRTMNPRAGGAARRRELLRRKYQNQVPTVPAPVSRWPGAIEPPGGKDGGQVNGYHTGGGVPHDHFRGPGTPQPPDLWTPRTPIRTRRQQQQQAYLTGAAPRGGPRGGQTGGVVGYRNGGRTMNPRAAAAAAMRRNRPRPIREGFSPSGQLLEEPRPWPVSTPPGGWQLGGEVGAAPEEVAMASEIYARATPEQQDQITGGGGGPGMMEEEAAIGEALAMAMGGGGGGPLMNGGGPPMGGPPMGGPPMNGAPPMGGLI